MRQLENQEGVNVPPAWGTWALGFSVWTLSKTAGGKKYTVGREVFIGVQFL